jgi:hypothetical protein
VAVEAALSGLASLELRMLKLAPMTVAIGKVLGPGWSEEKRWWSFGFGWTRSRHRASARVTLTARGLDRGRTLGVVEVVGTGPSGKAPRSPRSSRTSPALHFRGG